MISRLKEVVNQIVACIEMDDSGAALQAIASFTLLFEEFMRHNKDYIFEREITRLNLCLTRMMEYMERNDLRSLRDTLTSAFVCFLNDWDFDNKPLN